MHDAACPPYMRKKRNRFSHVDDTGEGKKGRRSAGAVRQGGVQRRGTGNPVRGGSEGGKGGRGGGASLQITPCALTLSLHRMGIAENLPFGRYEGNGGGRKKEKPGSIVLEYRDSGARDEKKPVAESTCEFCATCNRYSDAAPRLARRAALPGQRRSPTRQMPWPPRAARCGGHFSPSAPVMQTIVPWTTPLRQAQGRHLRRPSIILR